jgi:hypothetical protein
MLLLINQLFLKLISITRSLSLALPKLVSHVRIDSFSNTVNVSSTNTHLITFSLRNKDAGFNSIRSYNILTTTFFNSINSRAHTNFSNFVKCAPVAIATSPETVDSLAGLIVVFCATLVGILLYRSSTASTTLVTPTLPPVPPSALDLSSPTMVGQPYDRTLENTMSPDSLLNAKEAMETSHRIPIHGNLHEHSSTWSRQMFQAYENTDFPTLESVEINLPNFYIPIADIILALIVFGLLAYKVYKILTRPYRPWGAILETSLWQEYVVGPFAGYYQYFTNMVSNVQPLSLSKILLTKSPRGFLSPPLQIEAMCVLGDFGMVQLISDYTVYLKAVCIYLLTVFGLKCLFFWSKFFTISYFAYFLLVLPILSAADAEAIKN